jgi:hypothetical protein
MATPTPSASVPAPASASAPEAAQLDPKTYAKLNELLQSEWGRVQIGDDPNKLDTINAFLQTYPYKPKKAGVAGEDAPSAKPWVDMTARQLFLGCIQTAIDVINDFAAALSVRNSISNADFRRSLFEAVAKPSRRVYIGLWLIMFSFILYFIDSAA